MIKRTLKLFALPLLLLATVVFATPMASGQCLAPPAGLVGWWPGDGNANDIVGTNNGVVTNGVSFVQGEVDACFQFNNTNCYVDVGNFVFPTTFTVETWVNPSSTNAMVILGKDDMQFIFGGLRTFFLMIESGGSVVGSIRNTDRKSTRLNSSH